MCSGGVSGRGNERLVERGVEGGETVWWMGETVFSGGVNGEGGTVCSGGVSGGVGGREAVCGGGVASSCL